MPQLGGRTRLGEYPRSGYLTRPGAWPSGQVRVGSDETHARPDAAARVTLQAMQHPWCYAVRGN